MKKELVKELKEHIPFTAIATLIAVVSVFIITKFGLFHLPDELFHGFHYLHVLVSGAATAAIFYTYRKKPVKAILVGMAGAIVIGSLSDVLFPYLGALVFALKPDFHLPIIESTLMILLFAFVGSFIGMKIKESEHSHSLHVFLSVFASFFYLYDHAYTHAINAFLLNIIFFLIIFVAVIIPCCLSDIIFPFFFVGKK